MKPFDLKGASNSSDSKAFRMVHTHISPGSKLMVLASVGQIHLAETIGFIELLFWHQKHVSSGVYIMHYPIKQALGF